MVKHMQFFTMVSISRCFNGFGMPSSFFCADTLMHSCYVNTTRNTSTSHHITHRHTHTHTTATHQPHATNTHLRITNSHYRVADKPVGASQLSRCFANCCCPKIFRNIWRGSHVHLLKHRVGFWYFCSCPTFMF